MILSYKECINEYGNDYQLARAIAEESVLEDIVYKFH